MQIQRIGTTRRWSDAVIHNNTLYLVEVPVNTLYDSIVEQTKEVLRNIELALEANGSNKNQLLMVNIYLATISDIELFNAIWDVWLPDGGAPVRACVEAKLANNQYKLELQVTAALNQE